MKLLGMIFAMALLPAAAQTLSIGTAPASPGENTTIAILFEALEGRDVASLQWDIEYPASVLSLPPSGIVAGEAARKSGKQLHCGGRWKKDGTYAYRCILAGGKGPVGSGAIAMLQAVVPPGARKSRNRIRLSEIIAVGADLRRIPLKNSETTFEVR